MRGWWLIVVFALLIAAMPVLAQRGGGHASGGHGGFAAHVSGGGHFGGMRSGSGLISRGFAGSRQSPSRQSFSRQSFAHQPSFVGRGSNSRFRSSRLRNFGHRNCFSCSRFGYGYPWGYAGFYDPYWWWDSGSSYDDDRARELDMANQMNQQNLEEQQMRQQGDQDIYAYASPSRQAQSAATAPADVVPPTVLVFRDQRKQEVQNYAIVGETLWSFSPQRAQKIPLSDLDLAATTKANDERGVDFRLPNSPEGQ